MSVTQNNICGINFAISSDWSVMNKGSGTGIPREQTFLSLAFYEAPSLHTADFSGSLLAFYSNGLFLLLKLCAYHQSPNYYITGPHVWTINFGAP